MFDEALFLSVAVKAIVDVLKKPLQEWKPGAHLWWFYYVAFVLGAALGWFSGLNVLDGSVEPLVGRVVTALVIGGGPTLFHDLWDATMSRIRG